MIFYARSLFWKKYNDDDDCDVDYDDNNSSYHILSIY